jgi:hypothetical protein
MESDPHNDRTAHAKCLARDERTLTARGYFAIAHCAANLIIFDLDLAGGGSIFQ